VVTPGALHHVTESGVRLMDVLFTVGDCVEYLRLTAADWGDGPSACAVSSRRPPAVPAPAPPTHPGGITSRYYVNRLRCVGYVAQRPTIDLTGLLTDVP